MALSLGQLLGGAGVVASRQRQAEEAERAARQNQLAIEAQNRAELARLNQMRSTQDVGAYGMAPSAAQFDLGLREVTPQFDGQLAPSRPAAAPAAPPAVAPPAAKPPTTAPAGDTTYEGLYQRIKALRSEGVLSPLVFNREVSKVAERLTDEEIARIYAIAINKEDYPTVNTLRPLMVNRGFDPKYLDEIGTKTRTGKRALAGVAKKEEEDRKAGEERRRLFEIKYGRAPKAATGEEILTPGIAATAAVTSQDAISRVLQREGGYVNDPADMGGETNFGISKKAYPKLDIANLTQAEAARIYKRDYWDRINADKLPANIREMAFDAAVNQGVAWTRKALQDSGNDPQKFLQLRAQRYQDIVAANPSQERFLQGWMNRLGEFAGGVMEAVVPTAAAAPAAAPTAPAVAAAPTAPAAGVGAARGQLKASDVYVANPQAITYDMQIAMQQREDLRRMANNYRNAGMMNEFNQLRAQLYQVDTNLLSLAGLQAVYQFGRTGDPRMLSAALSQKYGESIGFRPRSDGKYDLIANPNMENEKVLREAINGGDIVEEAKLEFDPATRAARADIAMFAAKEEIKGRSAKETAYIKAVADIQAAIIKGEADKAVELAKQNKVDLKQDATSGLWAVIKGNDVRIINPAEAQETVETPLGAIPRTPTARRVLGLNFGQ